jgi:NADPH:quinone reductase-like Zn-dependent oxidoreductase
MARETFAALEQGLLSPIDPVTFPLEQVGEAHFMLEKGQNPGGIVLLP